MIFLVTECYEIMKLDHHGSFPKFFSIFLNLQFCSFRYSSYYARWNAKCEALRYFVDTGVIDVKGYILFGNFSRFGIDILL